MGSPSAVALFRRSIRPPDRPSRRVRAGAYFHSARDLFRVEHVSGERALIEECRSGHVIDVPVSILRRLEPVG
jgi:hypothetical protein